MKTLTLILISLFAFAFRAEANLTTVELPAGTQVILETSERLSSGRATVGQLIRCKVKANVVVNGRVVIRTGATAMARVAKIEKNTYNQPEQISVTVISVQAADGQQLALHGTEQTIKGKFPSQGVELPVNTLLTGYVANNYSIY